MWWFIWHTKHVSLELHCFILLKTKLSSFSLLPEAVNRPVKDRVLRGEFWNIFFSNVYHDMIKIPYTIETLDLLDFQSTSYSTQPNIINIKNISFNHIKITLFQPPQSKMLYCFTDSISGWGHPAILWIHFIGKWAEWIVLDELLRSRSKGRRHIIIIRLGGLKYCKS